MPSDAHAARDRVRRRARADVDARVARRCRRGRLSGKTVASVRLESDGRALKRSPDARVGRDTRRPAASHRRRSRIHHASLQPGTVRGRQRPGGAGRKRGSAHLRAGAAAPGAQAFVRRRLRAGHRSGKPAASHHGALRGGAAGGKPRGRNRSSSSRRPEAGWIPPRTGQAGNRDRERRPLDTCLHDRAWRPDPDWDDRRRRRSRHLRSPPSSATQGIDRRAIPARDLERAHRSRARRPARTRVLRRPDDVRPSDSWTTTAR